MLITEIPAPYAQDFAADFPGLYSAPALPGNTPQPRGTIMPNATATTTHQPLNHDLPLLPPRPAHYDHQAMCAWLNERHDVCLQLSSNLLDGAAACTPGDPHIDELVSDARDYFMEAQRIRGMRTY